MVADNEGGEDGSTDIDRRLAVDLFNETWSLLETESRTHDQDERMVNAAHGSRYHWEEAGGPEQLVVGDWQISRVYSVLGRAEPALHHAREALTRAQQHEVPTWVLASAHEGMARAAAVGGDLALARSHVAEALSLANSVEDADDRQVILDDLATLNL